MLNTINNLEFDKIQFENLSEEWKKMNNLKFEHSYN